MDENEQNKNATDQLISSLNCCFHWKTESIATFVEISNYRPRFVLNKAD